MIKFKTKILLISIGVLMIISLTMCDPNLPQPDKISRITVCTFSGVANSNSTNVFYHYWTGADCDNGLPSGKCVGVISAACHSGVDQDWKVLLPGEVGPDGYFAVNGGISWWCTGGATDGQKYIRVVYYCYE